MSDILEIARWYVAHGISVIPVKADGSKSPALSGWRKYADELPSDTTLEQWFGMDMRGIGIPCGKASGNLVVLDFECDGESAYIEWFNRLPDELKSEVRIMPTVTTPSGGKHIWVRLPDSQPGGKLARYASGKTKIEIRGEGHQVLAPGCPAECHKSKKLYDWDIPPGDGENGAEIFPEMALLTWLELCDWCSQCNEYQAPDQPRDREISGSPAGEGSPGNDFNARGSWSETGLFDAGWTWARKTGEDKGFLTRPGKESGISASIGQVTSKDKGYPYLFVWSTSVSDFATETPYSRFAVYAILKHSGDFSAAAKELSRQGYGERKEFQADKHQVVDLSNFTMGSTDGVPFRPFAKPHPSLLTPIPEGEPAEKRIFKWSSELSAQADDARWIWQGYLCRGGATLFSAHPKAGKTTMLSHLLRALGGNETHFLGQPVVPSRVLYITEENESLWAARRDDLGIGNHCGFVCQKFKGRSTMPEWKAFIGECVQSVHKYQFDLVIMDTLGKLWPVREENDSSQVDEALLPLWPITEAGASLMLVHHSRKSGGGEFTSVRGSSALAGFTEIIMEFRRHSEDKGDAKRVIKAIGRLQGIPDENLVEWKPEGYISHGDPDNAEVRAATKSYGWEKDLMTVLECMNGEWLQLDDIQQAIADRRNGEKARKADLLAYLGKRIDDGEVERDGEGKRGDPYTYRIVV